MIELLICPKRNCTDNEAGACSRRVIAWSEITYGLCEKSGPIILDRLPEEPIKKEEK